MFSFAIAMIFSAGVAQAESALLGPISREVQSHVAKVVGIPDADVDVEWVGFDVTHACGADVDIDIETSTGEQFRGQTYLKVRLTEGGISCGRFSVPARIKLWKHVPVASEAVRPGEPVSIVDGRVAMSTIRGVLIDADSGPWVAARSIRAGQPLTSRYVKRKPAMSTGQSVDIVADFGGLQIKAEGRMLADAHLGDWVRVANLATDTVVQGQLIAPGTVRAGGRR